MSSVQGFVVCKQCGYGYADHIYNCRDSSEWMLCSRCGHQYESGPVYDPTTHHIVLDAEGKWVWKTEDSKGFGALCYRVKGAIGFCITGLDEDCAERLKADAEAAMNAGEFESEPLYLSRWNENTRAVELLLGNFLPEPTVSQQKELSATTCEVAKSDHC